MPVNIITFGQLKEITGSPLSIKYVADTNALIKELHNIYPALAETKYVIAVDKKIVNQNTKLTETSTVALLPPFSGG
jgi:molybdopterin converting factor small subunit